MLLLAFLPFETYAKPAPALQFLGGDVPAPDLPPKTLNAEWRRLLAAGHPFLVRTALAPALPAGRRPPRDGLVWLAPVPPDGWIVLPAAASAPRPPYVKWFGIIPPTAKKTAGLASARDRGGYLVRRGGGIGPVRATKGEELTRLLADPDVWAVAPSMPARAPANNHVRRIIGADFAQDAPWNLSGDGVSVAMWDEGRVLHADLAGRTTNLADGEASDHSTHVCGTMAGNGALSDGLYRGVAPRVRVFAWRYDDPVMDLPQALERNASWINNSWVYFIDDSEANCEYLGAYDSYTAEFDRAVAGEDGAPIGISFAGGNMGAADDCGIALRDGYGSIPPPATAKDIIAVGSTDDGRQVSFYSSLGPTTDGRIKPDLMAVGCVKPDPGYIVSTLPAISYGGTGWCGTSMAAPQVTGTAALLYELAARSAIALSPALVKALLIATARELEDPGPSYTSGWGELDTAAAVVMLAEQAFVTGELAAADEVFEQEITVPEGLPALEVTLAWDDPAAAETAARALVNDLELRLVDPAGDEILPWALDPDDPAAAAAPGEDHRNNVEQVRADAPAGGVWKVRVGAAALATAQPFALAGWMLGDPTCDGDADRSPGPQCDGDDCNDADPAVHPGAAEICGNGFDEDCDNQADESCDNDDDTTPPDDTTDDDQDAPADQSDDDSAPDSACGC